MTSAHYRPDIVARIRGNAERARKENLWARYHCWWTRNLSRGSGAYCQ